MKRKALGIQLDGIALLREGSHSQTPDPVLAAGMLEMMGVRQINVHLRHDRKYIQERDVRLLRQTVQTTLNMEMSPTILNPTRLRWYQSTLARTL